MTAQDSLHFFLTTSVFHCDWLGSDLRIGRFFYERRLSSHLRLNDDGLLVSYWMTQLPLLLLYIGANRI
jgi:hypothetical protein